jgi:hypothetical protein
LSEVSDLETVMRVLADKYGQYLYRSSAGWIVNNGYFGDKEFKAGTPSQIGYETIRGAACKCLEQLINRHQSNADQAHKTLEDATLNLHNLTDLLWAVQK